MDRIRGALLPLVLVAMAALLGVLGNLSADQGSALLEKARTGDMSVPGAVAPRAQAEARRRVFIKRGQEARLQATLLYGIGSVLGAGAVLLFLGQSRLLRARDLADSMGDGGAPPSAA